MAKVIRKSWKKSALEHSLLMIRPGIISQTSVKISSPSSWPTSKKIVHLQSHVCNIHGSLNLPLHKSMNLKPSMRYKTFKTSTQIPLWSKQLTLLSQVNFSTKMSAMVLLKFSKLLTRTEMVNSPCKRWRRVILSTMERSCQMKK